jgi:hypothetical protein
VAVPFILDLGTEVDDPPPNGLAELVRQALGRRPGQAVDQEHETRIQFQEGGAGIVGGGELAQLITGDTRPVRDDEDTIRVWHDVRRIDDERA